MFCAILLSCACISIVGRQKKHCFNAVSMAVIAKIFLAAEILPLTEYFSVRVGDSDDRRFMGAVIVG